VPPLLEAQGISKRFGGVLALGRVDFSIDRGEVVGLIGPNGAGKTTLFNVICGLRPTAGRIRFKGEEITGLAPHQICHRGIARTFQLTRPFLELSVQDNVAAAVLFGRRQGKISRLGDARDAADRILSSVKLDHRKTTVAGSLLFSERRRLEVARALATGPELLLLDEVMAGLTVGEAQDMVGLLMKLKRELGLTLLVIEHVMKVVMTMCDRVVVLNYGSKLADGVPREIARHPAVIDAYLGVESA
jgi:branched-chain amino acid transport system ATP-binding protein